MKYKDRGIMKWAPFDALDGHSSLIEEMIFNINKKEKRALSEDEYQELNEKIEYAINKNKEITIEYYKNGYTYTCYGKVNKIDFINRKLILDTGESIDLDDVLEAY